MENNYFIISRNPNGMADYEGDTKESCIGSAIDHLSDNDLNYIGYLNEYDAEDNLIKSEEWEAHYNNTCDIADYMYDTRRENTMEGNL